jgi:hypothetical protein
MRKIVFIFAVLLFSISLFAVTDSEIRSAASMLGVGYEDLKMFVESYNNPLINPPAEFIIQRLSRIPEIGEIQAATEDNDPNRGLNKAGSYTAQVYFESNIIDQSGFDELDVVGKGTDCGGSIEVFSTVADAERRNSYLGNFDGTIFASGSHRVIGTIVVRTSNKLTATQQKNLEAQIIEGLTAEK